MPRKVGRCRLSLLLHIKAMTQRQLSEKTGINTNQLSAYATNRKVMSYQVGRIISEALGVRMEDLYENE